MTGKVLILTAHAQTRMRSRQIKAQWVEATVREPLWTERDPQDRQIERRFRAIHEFGERILRVACIENESTIRVISVMFDRNARPKS